MNEPDPVVTVFVRHDGRVLLEETTEGGLDGLTRPLEETAADTAMQVLQDVLDVSDAQSELTVGEGFDVPERHLHINPVIVDVDRDLGDVSLHARYAWRHPSALRRETAQPGAWRAYRAVGPRVQSVLDDRTHGSTTVSVRALEVLRDEAAAGAVWSTLADGARDMIDNRGEMAALVTRIDRTMSRAGTEATPGTVEAVAREEIERAVAADREAAARGASTCEGKTVLTLSRSGTVQGALREGDPAAVIFLESRPGREAVPVAEALAEEGVSVSLQVDAAAAAVLARREVDLVMVGADRIEPNGDVRNKLGTRTLAIAAQAAGVPVVVVAASDKIATSPAPEAWIDTTTVYDGPHAIDTTAPLFDRTPPELISTLLTERGSLSPEETTSIAADRRNHRSWRDPEGPMPSV